MSDHTPSPDTAAPQAAVATDANEAAAAPSAAPDLATQLAELQAKNAELADLYLRAQADVHNARRRADEEIA